ncbi:MAG: SDR family NAD(P)-dependent oxidoreductase [Vicingaceae bacterium]
MKILISGASKGLGKAMAERLCQEGHELFLIARSQDKLQMLKQNWEKQYGQSVNIIAFDLSQTEKIKNLPKLYPFLEQTEVLINNLGHYVENKPTELTIEQLQQQFNLNLYSAIALSDLFLDNFKSQKKGSIININSVMGLNGASHASAYAISKHGLKAWNDSLREEMRPFGVKVCSLYPGAINTPSWDGQAVDRTAMIQTEDIAEIVNSLLKLGTSTLVEEVRLSPLHFSP